MLAGFCKAETSTLRDSRRSKAISFCWTKNIVTLCHGYGLHIKPSEFYISFPLTDVRRKSLNADNFIEMRCSVLPSLLPFLQRGAVLSRECL